MKQLIENTKINEILERHPLLAQNLNRGYNPIWLINNLWVSILSGASRFEHLEVTRMDKVIQKIFSWKQMAVINLSKYILRNSDKQIINEYLPSCSTGFSNR